MGLNCPPGNTMDILCNEEAFAARTKRRGVRCAHGVVRCAHGGQPPEYERSASCLQNVMSGIALPQNRQKSHPDQPETDLETPDFERKMAQSEILIRLGRG